MRIMHGFVSFSLILFCLFYYTGIHAAVPGHFQASQLVDGIAIKVNEDIVTLSQWRKAYHLLQYEREDMPEKPSDVELRSGAKDRWINQLLQTQSEDWDGALSAAQKARVMTNWLRMQKKSKAEIKKRLAKFNLAWADLEQHVYNGLLTQRFYQQKFANAIEISDAQVHAMVQGFNGQILQYEIIDYFMSTESDSDSSMSHAGNKMQTMYRAMRKDLNKAYALPQGVEAKSWGWTKLADIPANFVDQIRKTSHFPALLAPIKTANGYHVLKILAKKESRPPLKASQARQMLWSEAMDQKILHWLTEQRAAAYIQTVRSLTI